MATVSQFQNPSIYGPNNPVYGSAFSANAADVINLGFLKLNQAGVFSADPTIREKIIHNVYEPTGILDWMEANMGKKMSCYKDYKLAHYFPSKRYLNLANGAVINVPIAPGTVAITWPAAETYNTGTFVLPAIGGALSVAPEGNLLYVTNITSAAGVFTVTVQNKNFAAFVIPINSDVIVLSGKELADCECPSGTSVFEGTPLLETVKIIRIANKTNPICGDALLACQNMLFEYQITDENGCLKTYHWWYDAAYKGMVSEHRRRKKMELLNNPTFGIIPKIRKYGIKWTWNDPANLALVDLESFALFLANNSISANSFSFYLEMNAFASAQRLARTEGHQKIMFGSFNPGECKILDLQFCTISHMGIDFHFYREGAFNDKNYFGGAGFSYSNKGIGIPMTNRMDRPGEGQCTSTNKKHITMVTFQDGQGNIWDEVVDSNGVLNTMGDQPPSMGNNFRRNTFGTGCVSHEYSIESDFTVELHEPEKFVWVN
jgi:hypothetical protein